MATIQETPDVLTAQCLCGAQTFAAKITDASRPMKATTCHCNSCRHMTGAMYSSETAWPGDACEIEASTLKRYVFSDSLTVLFCGDCGSTMFWRIKERHLGASEDGVRMCAFTGVLANLDVPDLVRFEDHILLGDTLDGGAAPWLRRPNADAVKPRFWRGRPRKSEELGHGWLSAVSRLDATAQSDEIPIKCRCGGVNFVIRRPGSDYVGRSRSELPWFVDPVTYKNLGGFDACNSCRVASGSDMFNWTFSLLRHVAFPGSSEFPGTSLELKAATAQTQDRDPRLGTLTFYASSPDVQRYFCSRCSACVFYGVDDRPEMINVAVGLLEAPDGARAESFLSWAFGGPIGWRDDTAGGWRRGFVEAVEAEGEAWRIERGYPKNWRRA